MNSKSSQLNTSQILFKELFVGTLIYAVVLGFFNDYTTVVYAKSFSTIFFAAIVLEALTYIAFLLKRNLVALLKARKGAAYRFLLFFSVWFIMFISKFVFIWVIDLIFGNLITINGFFGILFVVLSVTIIHTIANKLFIKLGDETVVV